MTTEYRDVKDVIGYRVGNDGTVWTRFVKVGMTWRLADEWRQLKPAVVSKYLQVVICSNGKRIQRKVHKLVLEAFVGPKPNGAVCRHLDGNHLNNHISNIVWGTLKENAEDRRVHGRQCEGERHHWTKLTKEEVLDIRKDYDGGNKSITAIAKERGLPKSTVDGIARRKCWKNV